MHETDVRSILAAGGRNVDMTALARNWWALAIRGAAAIIFGLLTFVLPGVTLAVLLILFGAYAIVDGIFSLIAAFRAGPVGERPRWLLGLEGLVSIAAGIVAFAMPGLTALVLVYVIAVWAVITGVLEIVAAVRLRQEISNEWWLVASGVLSVIFGLLLFAAPGAGALALVFWIGAYAIVFGALLVGLAFRLRRQQNDVRAEMRRAA
jgi:uncharacterized membrane protein HdeD (DUF308 family)